MVKVNQGFTLMELMIGLAVVGVLAVSVIPSMNSVLNKQTLKVVVSRLNTYVDQARNLAAITECPVKMSLRPGNGAVNVQVAVEHDPFMKGCTAWYSQTNNQNNREFSATLDNITLASAVSLHFNAVSGVLDTQNQTRLTLNYRDKRAEITYLGIGNGVVSYE
ncbi:prepilin-type N-terminal cleavage/methylation domain-containing protein [Limnobacter sp.]|uniref:prepilin-type N-terminal cleavage/methylation domain-containing protein n=1 Tax=Limnobacter sp. TaxID=2003368 RepID=UPI002FE1CA82